MAAAGSVANILKISPGFMAERRLRARNTGSGQSNPRTSSSASWYTNSLDTLAYSN